MCRHTESPSLQAEPPESQRPSLPEGKTDYQKKLFIYRLLVILTACITLLSTNLLWGVRVDKLVVDAAGLYLLHVRRRNSVLLTGQPELQVLLTELWAQEPTKRLQSAWLRGRRTNQSQTLVKSRRVNIRIWKSMMPEKLRPHKDKHFIQRHFHACLTLC